MAYVSICVPLCKKNLTSSTKPEVHNVLHCRQTRTWLRPQKNSWSLDAWFLRHASGETDRETYRNTDCNTSYPPGGIEVTAEVFGDDRLTWNCSCIAFLDQWRPLRAVTWHTHLLHIIDYFHIVDRLWSALVVLLREAWLVHACAGCNTHSFSSLHATNWCQYSRHDRFTAAVQVNPC